VSGRNPTGSANALIGTLACSLASNSSRASPRRAPANTCKANRPLSQRYAETGDQGIEKQIQGPVTTQVAAVLGLEAAGAGGLAGGRILEHALQKQPEKTSACSLDEVICRAAGLTEKQATATATGAVAGPLV
jgi:hypothetical protein